MGSWMPRLIGGASWITLAAAVGLWFGRQHPRLELASNFRPHLFVATLAVFPAVALLGWRRSIVVMVAATAVQAVAVVPYLVGDPVPVPPGVETARVLQYNVLYRNADHDAIVEEILASRADVVALHEITTTQWAAIGPRIADAYPHTLVNPVDLAEPGSRGGGKAILSTAPLHQIDVGGDFAWPPMAATTVVGGEDVLVVALHPSPSRTNGWLLRERARKLAATIEVVERVGLPTIVITDLNVTPTSHVYADLLRDLGWNDPRRSLGVAPTWPAGRFRHLGVAIDHVLVSPELRVHEYQLGDGGGSDHRSVTAVVSFRR